MEQFEKKESREAFGNNVEIHAYFFRHAPGDKKTGELTTEGLNIAKSYGEKFTPSDEGNSYLIKAYSSEMDRANQTAEEIIQTVDSNRKGHTRIKIELGEKDEDVRIPIEPLKLSYTEYIKVCEEREKIGDKLISLHDLAKRIASQIDHFIKLSKRLKNDSTVDLLNVTHIPWIQAFLKEVLKEKSDNLDLFTDYVSGFELLIKRNGDDFSLVLKFRDMEFLIRYEEVEEIIK